MDGTRSLRTYRLGMRYEREASAMFMKNLGLLGGALLIAYRGDGPVSLDERARRTLQEAIPARAVA